MGVNVQSGTVTATGVTVSDPTEQVLSYKDAGVASNTSATVGTVGASKKWYILNMTLTCQAVGVNALAYVKVNTAIVAVLKVTPGIAQTLVIKWDYLRCPVATAAQTVTIWTEDAGGGTGYCCINYIEKSV